MVYSTYLCIYLSTTSSLLLPSPPAARLFASRKSKLTRLCCITLFSYSSSFLSINSRTFELKLLFTIFFSCTMLSSLRRLSVYCVKFGYIPPVRGAILRSISVLTGAILKPLVICLCSAKSLFAVFRFLSHSFFKTFYDSIKSFSSLMNFLSCNPADFFSSSVLLKALRLAVLDCLCRYISSLSCLLSQEVYGLSFEAKSAALR